jgi:hypothetical protein
MEFLIVNRLRDSADERLGPAIRDHLRWVTHGLRTGDIVRAGRWGRGGMCSIEAPDETSAVRILGEDPLVAEGLVDFEMAAITPATDPEIVASDPSDVPTGSLSERS